MLLIKLHDKRYCWDLVLAVLLSNYETRVGRYRRAPVGGYFHHLENLDTLAAEQLPHKLVSIRS